MSSKIISMGTEKGTNRICASTFWDLPFCLTNENIPNPVMPTCGDLLLLFDTHGVWVGSRIDHTHLSPHSDFPTHLVVVLHHGWERHKVGSQCCPSNSGNIITFKKKKWSPSCSWHLPPRLPPALCAAEKWRKKKKKNLHGWGQWQSVTQPE